MEKYIPLDAVVAEIEKVISGLRRNCNPNPLGNMQECLAAAEIEALNLIKNSLSTLEVKEVQEEPVSEDLPKIIERKTLDEYAYQCAYDMSNDWARDNATWKEVQNACKLGAKWQIEQLMAKAINTEASLTMSVPSICISLPLGVNVGDKVKVIVIKED